MVLLLTENMSALKCHINIEKQSCNDDPAHMDTVSEDEEELEIPMYTMSISLPSFVQQVPTPVSSPELVTAPSHWH